MEHPWQFTKMWQYFDYDTDAIYTYSEQIADLSDEQKEQLEKLTESVTDISSVSEREMFIIGFRLGVKLMIDVMK